VKVWRTARFEIDLSRPRVMGIVNVTPDSFADGGQHAHTVQAIAHLERLRSEGADIVDIGGESSRPGAQPVAVQEELERVLPVLRHAVRLGIPVSVDTRRTAVMQLALDEGADIINDIQSLRDAGAEQLLARHPSAGVCLMHMRGEPASMQQAAQYLDVMAEVSGFLRERTERLLALGMARERIVLDPGIGFAKTADHNLQLHRRQSDLLALGFPLLVGWSRKSTLGTITGRPVNERLSASLAAALASATHGARVMRVHDVAATVDALKVWQAFGMPIGPDNNPSP
jgi:dihydropteroate synthase